MVLKKRAIIVVVMRDVVMVTGAMKPVQLVPPYTDPLIAFPLANYSKSSVMNTQDMQFQ